jgi:hypothetical protein
MPEFTYKSIDGTEKTVVTPYKYPPCPQGHDHARFDHPVKLDIEKIRAIIPHSVGEHPANSKGFLLCNGHCAWDDMTCSGIGFLCLNCGYAECWGCAEDFGYALEDIYKEWSGAGITEYCRGCGSHSTMVEMFDLKWLGEVVT